MVTNSELIEWINGTRMFKSDKDSSAFWRELAGDKYYEDNFKRYGEGAFLPEFVKRVHRSKL
jgi:hypothetical protein